MTDLQSWEIAREKCVLTYHGDLASVHSRPEQIFLMWLLNDDPKNVAWIGLYRINDTLFWSDGSPVDFEAWLTGEPNNLGGVVSFFFFKKSGQ